MGQTLENLYQTLRQQLQPVTRSPDQASAEANMIVANILGYAPEDVYMAGNKIIPEPQCLALEDLLHQRVHKRIPIQYLLHQAWFYGLQFYVNPHVLIPRPETELLVEEALKLVKPGVRILDIGTGPGTIAITIAKQLGATAEVVATDLSKEALRVARINRQVLGVAVDLRQGDLFEPVAGERFDIIVSNPPYIDQNLRPTLDAEVVWHEPEIALFSPTPDAYYFYRRLAAEGKAHLNPGGHLLVEMGAGMGVAVRDIFTGEGFTNVQLLQDYAGLDRIVIATMAQSP
ncbi:MAG TPA: peptide chain release factor N(5)-glutamine methyltransferase [Coleofasciculaceae cyanobacterium]|jgi:release factor glutamine methyltransferase